MVLKRFNKTKYCLRNLKHNKKIKFKNKLSNNNVTSIAFNASKPEDYQKVN